MQLTCHECGSEDTVEDDHAVICRSCDFEQNLDDYEDEEEDS